MSVSRTKKVYFAFYLLHAGPLLGLLFDPEDGGDMFLRNNCSPSLDYAVLFPEDKNLQYLNDA
jgi:hypothetical protein